MKFNWKALIAIALIVVVAVWAVDSLRTRAYAGEALTFSVGHGVVTMTNPSDTPASVQLIGTGSRGYTVSSTTGIDGGSSAREGTGRSTTHVFALVLPPGNSEFSVNGGTDVKLVGDAETRLSASVQPASDGETRTVLIASAIVILGALYYIYRATGQTFLSAPGSRKRAAELLAKQTAEAANASHLQGQTYRSYGDNRSETPV